MTPAFQPPARLIVLAGLLVLGGLAATARHGVAALLTTAPVTALPIFHLAAELGMALTPALGALAWRRGAAWGPAVMLIGFGTWIYAVLNAAGWAVANDRFILVPLGVSLVIAAWLGGPLLRDPAATDATPRRRTVATVILVVFALQVLGLWTMYFVTGVMAHVLEPRVDVGLHAIRLAGDLIAAGLALAAATGWRHGRPWAPGLAQVVAGMALYAGLNDLSDAVLASLAETSIRLVTLLVAAGLVAVTGAGAVPVVGLDRETTRPPSPRPA